MADMINHPPHYASGDGVECIDAIKSAMSREEFMGYLRGNLIKYTWRFRNKGGGHDLRKADWYLDRLIQEWEAESNDGV